MTVELNVVQRTQRIVVDPTSRSVSIVNAGPIGPAGPAGAPGAAANGIPSGGTTNQLLAKSSDADYAAGWVAAPAAANGLPTGGTTGQVLAKNSATSFDAGWTAPGGGSGISDGDKGDITVSGTGATWTIDPDAVTNAKLMNMVAARIKGRITGSTGDPEDLTGTQVTTMLDLFTSTLKGLVPLSGGGTTDFLRADGSWEEPPGVTPNHPNTPYHYMHLAISADATANTTLTDMAAAEDYFGASGRHATMADLLYFTHCRLIIRRMSGSAAAGSPALTLQYATAAPNSTFNGAEWTPSGASCSLTPTNATVDSGWVAMPTGMKINDVHLAVVQAGGDGAADPVVGGVRVIFRGPISHS